MLFKLILKSFEIFWRNKQQAQAFLLLLLPALLLFKPSKYKIHSRELLFDSLDVDDETGFYGPPIDYKVQPPNETIYIHFEGSHNLYNILNEKIKKITIRSKSIKLSREDANEHFFIKLYLKENVYSALEMHPLRNFQPNSDLLTAAACLFDPFLKFDLMDFLLYKFENRIDILVNNDEASITKICNLLRYYLNIHSHYRGSYYYIPLKKRIIKLNSLKLFIAGYILYELIKGSSKFDLGIFLIKSIVYYLFPPAGLFLGNLESRAIYAFIFCIMNFKVGFVCCLYWYLHEFVSFVLNQLKAKLKNREKNKVLLN